MEWLALVGSGVNAIGKLMSSSSQAAMDRLQADAYGTNATIQQGNADLLSKEADIADMGIGFAWAKERTAQARIEDAGRETLAAQRSYFASNNLDPSFGSPLLAQANTAGRIATDVDLTRANAAIEAANARTQGANLRTQAAGQQGAALSSLMSQKGALMKADADMTAGYFGAATALLNGFSGLATSGKSGSSGFSIDLSSFGFNPIAGATGA